MPVVKNVKGRRKIGHDIIPNPGWLNSFCQRVRQTAEGRWQKGKKKKEFNWIVGVSQPDLVSLPRSLTAIPCLEKTLVTHPVSAMPK